MAAVKRILVIGGGIGGLCAAIGLKKEGFEVEVWEINTSTKVYHVGIIVHGNFLGALDRIGIADQAIAAGYPYDAFDFYDMDGTHLHPGPAIRLVERFPASLGITRPALHKVLLDEVARLEIPLHLGRTFTDLEEGKDDIRVTSNEGETTSFDLVVGADGIASETRKIVAGPTAEPEFVDMAVWRYNFTRLPEVDGLQVFKNKPGSIAGLVPLSEDTMYAFLVDKAVGNLRAGCAGLIPAPDAVDRLVPLYEAFRRGDEASAERIYAEVLPCITFVMQSIATLLCYGKRIVAWRLGVDTVYDRQPALAPTPFGLECAKRYADQLGPFPGNHTMR